MQIEIELPKSRASCMRHFKERTPLHEILDRATGNDWPEWEYMR
jgi:hypothetical protein